MYFISGLTVLKNNPTTSAHHSMLLFSSMKCVGMDKSYSLPPLASTSTSVVLDNPVFNKNVKIDIPLMPFYIEKIDKLNERNNSIIEDPVIPSQAPEKHAIVMIIRRRRKMKKHKLKKLRIRMKFEWAKIRQRREMKKEKAFQLEMSTKVKEGERFSAEQYVENKLQLLHAEQLAESWKNVPESFIKEWTERKERHRNEKQAKESRKKALHSIYVKDWGVDFSKNQ